MTDSSGRVLNFTVTNGLITGITDPLGRTVSCSSTNGELTGVTDVLSSSTTYTYDGGGRHHLLSNSNPLGDADFANTYDDADRVVKQLRVSAGTNTYTCFCYGAWPPYTDANCPDVSPTAQAGQTVVVDARGNKTPTASTRCSRPPR